MLLLRRLLSLAFLAIACGNPLRQYLRTLRDKRDSKRDQQQQPMVLPVIKVSRGKTSSSGASALSSKEQKSTSVAGIAVAVVVLGAAGGAVFVFREKLMALWRDRQRYLPTFPSKSSSTSSPPKQSSSASSRQSSSSTSTASSSSASKAASKSSSSSTPLFSAQMRVQELLNCTKVMQVEAEGVSTPLPRPVAEEERKEVVLIFDCDERMNGAENIAARSAYFNMMANLTTTSSSNRSFTTVYVPGRGNPHAIERNATFRPLNWRYLSSDSTEGKESSRALREKFNVAADELRIVVLGASHLEVISDNALDLLRISPYEMPWTPAPIHDLIGSSFLSPALPSSHADALINVDLKNKVTALYFSASWCKPCQVNMTFLLPYYPLGLTPTLIITLEFYSQACGSVCESYAPGTAC